MRTTTNIYLFNLAVADLATLLFAMPSELYLMWRQYPWTLGEVHTSCVLYTILGFNGPSGPFNPRPCG